MRLELNTFDSPTRISRLSCSSRQTRQFIMLIVAICIMKAEAVGQFDAPVDASLCDLYERPDDYDGRMVRLRGSLVGHNPWIESPAPRSQPTCSAYMRVVIALPEDIEPDPGFDLARDASLAEFIEAQSGPHNIHVTVEGLFVSYISVQDGVRVRARDPDRELDFDGRIVLRGVSDVVAYPIPAR
jgi:hypothetical protein